jgi:cathepsin L
MEFEFMQYVAKFGKNYASVQEFEHRLETWGVKDAFIKAHDASLHGYTAAHNQFSDWTDAEWDAFLTHQQEPEDVVEEEPVEDFVGSEVNWVTAGCVNAIKDQGQCGSCWAFSGVSTFESEVCITNTDSLPNLSEQQQVDCNTRCYGCNGGWGYMVFDYYENYAAMKEAAYPYTAKDGVCQYSSSNNTGLGDRSYSRVSKNSPSSMKSALDSHTLSVSVAASSYAFQTYSSGVFADSTCGTYTNHATNVVGWGTDGSTEYWLMRNSWGTSWGDNGYMKLAIVDGHGYCAIQTAPYYPNM